MRKLVQFTLPYTKCLPKSFHTLKMMKPSLSVSPKIFPCQNLYMFSATNHENISKSNYEGPGFYTEQLLTGCLSVYSYYIQSNDEAFLIDPLNDTGKYEQILKERGSKLKGVFLTHYHADYVAGHLELSRKFGCNIYMGPKAFPTYGIKVLKDGETIQLGSVKLQLVHTPGHTEESSCMLVVDKSNKQNILFTGDTIFLNQVGRPDLAVKTDLTSKDLASMLYDSIQKVKKLNDQIRIYPGHGAGSSCGKSIGQGDFCTLGGQKENNYALKATNKESFVKQILSEMPNPPQYFAHDAGINKYHPFDYEEVQKYVNNYLTPEEMKEAVEENAIIIDIRGKEVIKDGIIKGSLCIDFQGGFASWVGTLLNPKNRYIIYANDEAIAKETIKRLLRIGYTNIDGYSVSPVEKLKKYFEVYPAEYAKSVIQKGYSVLDIRKPKQWSNGTVKEGDTVLFELSDLYKHLDKLDKSKKYIIHCQSGYRARIAYTFLKNHGYETKVYVDSFQSIQDSGVKVGA